MKSVFLGDAEYKLLVVSVARDLPACPWTGGPDVERAKRELGERLDVWPETIREDATRNDHL